MCEVLCDEVEENFNLYTYSWFYENKQYQQVCKKLLTNHASKAWRTKEACTARLTIISPVRDAFWVLQVSFLFLRNTTSPSWFTPRTPRSQITVLIRFQYMIICIFFLLLVKTSKVELHLCCWTYSLSDVSCYYNDIQKSLAETTHFSADQ